MVVKGQTRAWVGLALLLLAIFVIPNPYGTWLVALIILTILILSGMDMVNSNSWVEGLITVVIISAGLFLLLFIGSGGGEAENELPRPADVYSE